jgi:hypothetical protein
MKIRFVLIICLAISLMSKAQVTDTLGYTAFQLGTPTLYASPNGGYAFGNNGYQDKAKAQTYYNEDAFVLRLVLVEFGDVIFQSADSSSVVRVSVYDNHGVGVSSIGEVDSIAPDSVLSWVDIPVHSILDDGSFTVAEFDHDTVVLSGRFSVGIDLTHLAAGDTVGVVSTTDGDAGGTINAWELTSGDVWFSVEQSAFSWGLDVDLAIFPVIDENDPAGIATIGNSEFVLYPNPALDFIQIRGLSQTSYQAEIFDLKGSRVIRLVVENDSEIDISFLDPGLYMLVVVDDNFSVSNRFVKR